MDRFCLLRIANVELFWYQYTKTSQKYLSPFAVLKQLEDDVCYTDTPDSCIAIGANQFLFDRFVNDGVIKYAVYNYVIV